MNHTDTTPNRWYVADNRRVVDHEGGTIAEASGNREATQIAKDHNAIRDALLYLDSSHIEANLFRMGALGRQDFETGIKRLKDALSIQEREGQQ